MAAPWQGLTADQRQTLTMAGVGIVGAASVFGGMLWVVRRQIVSGDMLRVRLVHEIDPETKQLIESYQPLAEQAVARGVDVNMRLFRRKAEEEGVDVSDLVGVDFLGALAPRNVTEDAYGKKSSSGSSRSAHHPLSGAASFSKKESDLWFPVKVELAVGGRMVRGFVEAAKLPLRTGAAVPLYRADAKPTASTYLGRYRRTGNRGFLSLLERVE